ncbi:MAG: RodZ domain-containing protein [Pseudomonadota bacterium]|nr:RodZ domain-containing protein [Pseudomonadota bacterium]
MAEQEPIEPAEQEGRLPPKPGGLLKAAREARGLSLDELVVQTKLPRSMIDAIEGDNFALLSEPVYVRGYYRKYARVVGADEATVIAAYEAHAGGELPKLEIPVLLQDEPMRQRRRWPLVVLILLLVAGVIGLVLWLLAPDATSSSAQVSSNAAPRVSEPATIRQAAPPQAVPASGQAGDSTAADAGSRSSTSAGGPRRLALETRIASAPQPVEPATSREAEAGEPVEEAVVEPEPPLVLRFKEASWVRVEDGSGRRVLNGLVQGGEVREIDEQGPYAVFLGYAPGVEVSFQGAPVDVSAYVRGNNTARFTVE